MWLLCSLGGGPAPGSPSPDLRLPGAASPHHIHFGPGRRSFRPLLDAGTRPCRPATQTRRPNRIEGLWKIPKANVTTGPSVKEWRRSPPVSAVKDKPRAGVETEKQALFCMRSSLHLTEVAPPSSKDVPSPDCYPLVHGFLPSFLESQCSLGFFKNFIFLGISFTTRASSDPQKLISSEARCTFRLCPRRAKPIGVMPARPPCGSRASHSSRPFWGSRSPRLHANHCLPKASPCLSAPGSSPLILLNVGVTTPRN